MNVHLIAKIGFVALVAAVAFLTAWQGSGFASGPCRAHPLGHRGLVAVAAYKDVL